MFGFTKQELKKEINRLDDELDVLIKKQNIIDNRILAIDNFHLLKHRLRSSSIEVILEFVGYIIALAAANFVFAPISVQFVTVVTAVFSLLFGYMISKDGYKVFCTQKNLKKSYKKCLSISNIVFKESNKIDLLEKLDDVYNDRKVLNDKLLNEVSEVLDSQKDIITYNINCVMQDKKNFSDELKEFSSYEDTTKRYFNGVGLIFSQPETLEDYKKILQQYRKFKEIEQSTFEESTNYSSFSYDYNSGYIEGPKTKALKRNF